MKSLLTLAVSFALAFAARAGDHNPAVRLHPPPGLRTTNTVLPLPPPAAMPIKTPLPMPEATSPTTAAPSPLPGSGQAMTNAVKTEPKRDPQPLRLAFDLDSRAQPLQGSILRGKGFRIWADWLASDYGTLRFYFQQLYRGLPLNEWSGGDGFPAAFEGGVNLELPAPDGGPRRIALEYDLHTIRLSVSNVTSGVLTNLVLWRDNMTDALGDDGPDALLIDNPAVSNVSFTPADPLEPSRYVWEGVIGNTSQALVGPSVHAPWWPISKMVSRGSNVFYTCGYNEGKWDVQKFDISNPQVVVTNFSLHGRKQLGPPWPVDLSYFDDRTLLVKYNDSNVVAFDAATTAKLIDHLPEWNTPNVQVPTNDSSAIAVDPADSNIVAVYYHTTDQVVVYRNASAPGAWETNFVIGVASGYANGPSVLVPTNTLEFRENVKLSGFYYDANGTTNADARMTNAVLCFQSDGKLWVSDTLTSRMLRFDTNGLCDTWFMFVAHTYQAYVDPNDPKRVFAGDLEFEVDYTNAISNCWTLKNCWTRYDNGAELERGDRLQNGIFSPVTLTNNGVAQTFALARDPAQGNRRRMVELTARGVRATSIDNQSPFLELEADGSAVVNAVGPTPQAGTTAFFYRDSIARWSGADPVYSRAQLATVNYANNVCPIYWNAAKLRGSKLFLFYPDKKQLECNDPEIPFTGSHLGAVDVAQGGSWLWMNSPTGPLDGHGCFETNCHYAGSGFAVVDDDVFFVYRGEGWRSGQANQIFHYKTDGTFVGQFGTPNFVQGTLANAPGAGSNVGNISAVKVNGTIYLYTGDEWSHGVHRWRIENAPPQ